MAKAGLQLLRYCNVIGGKQYDNGNVVLLGHRFLLIEFDSDFDITLDLKSKNWRKRAAKIVKGIPQTVHPDWFAKHGWDVPPECFT